MTTFLIDNKFNNQPSLSLHNRVLNSSQFKLNIPNQKPVANANNSEERENSKVESNSKSILSESKTDNSANGSYFRDDMVGIQRNALRYLQNQRLKQSQNPEDSNPEDSNPEDSNPKDIDALKKALLEPLGVREEDIKDISIDVNFQVSRKKISVDSNKDSDSTESDLLQTDGLVWIVVDGELKDGRKFHVGSGIEARVTENLNSISADGSVDDSELDSRIILGNDFGGGLIDLNGDGVDDTKSHLTGGYGALNFEGADFIDPYAPEIKADTEVDNVVDQFKNFNQNVEDGLFDSQVDLKARALASLKKNIEKIYGLYDSKFDNFTRINSFI